MTWRMACSMCKDAADTGPLVQGQRSRVRAGSGPFLLAGGWGCCVTARKAQHACAPSGRAYGTSCWRPSAGKTMCCMQRKGRTLTTQTGNQNLDSQLFYSFLRAYQIRKKYIILKLFLKKPRRNKYATHLRVFVWFLNSWNRVQNVLCVKWTQNVVSGSLWWSCSQYSSSLPWCGSWTSGGLLVQETREFLLHLRTCPVNTAQIPNIEWIIPPSFRFSNRNS